MRNITVNGSAGMAVLLDKLDMLGSHSLVVFRDNKLFGEAYWYPYNKNQGQSVYSISKSFTAAAMMFAMQEGILSEDTRVCDVLKNKIDFLPGERMRKVTVRNLLSMTFGYVEQGIQSFYLCSDWIREALQLQLQNEPGTSFFYDNRCPFLCSAMLKELTGMDLFDYLRPRLFVPLGMNNVSWEKNAQGYNPGSYGLNIRTMDIAKFGLFLLNKGIYGGKELLQRKYVDKLSAVHIDTTGCTNTDDACGYGYYFWKCSYRHAFRAAGIFGQYCIILPDENMVIAITGGTEQEAAPAVLSAVWDFAGSLLPDKHESSIRPQPGRIWEISRPYHGETKGAVPVNEKIIFDNNMLGLQSMFIKWAAGAKKIFLVLETMTKKFYLRAGYDHWEKNITGESLDYDSCATIFYNNAYAACNIAENEISIRLVYSQSPFVDTFLLKCSGDEVICHYLPTPQFSVRCHEEYIHGHTAK